MPKFYKCFFAALVLSLIGAGHAAQAGSANHCEYSHEFYKKHDALDDATGDMVAPIIKNILAVVSPKDTLNLNQPCAPGKLNVLVFSSRKIPDPEWRRLAESKVALDKFIAATNNNAQAVGNNLIVVDGAMIQDIAHLIFMSALYHVNMLDDMKKILSSNENEITKLFESARRDRVYSAVMDFGSLRYINVGKGVYSERMKNSRDVGNDIFSIIMSEGQESPALLPLSTLFLHEIAHLKNGSSGGFADPLELINSGAEAIRNYLASLEEKQADEFTMKMLPKVMEKHFGSKNMAANRMLASSNTKTYMGFVRYMRDIMMTDVLRDFRGLNAEDVLVRFSYTDCSDDPEWANSGGPDNLNTVHDGVRRFGNLVTRDEFARIRQRIYAATASKPHLNSILRGEAFFGVFNRNPDLLQALIGDERAIYDAAYRDDPSSLSDLVIKPYEQDGDGTGLRHGDVQSIFGKDYAFESAVNCPVDFCAIGKPRSNKPGYMEIVGPKDNIFKITSVFPLYVGASGAARADHIRALDHVLKLFRLAGGWKDKDIPKSESENIVDFITSAMENMAMCGTATREHKLGDIVVRLTTVNEAGVVEVTIRSESRYYPQAPKI